MTVRIHEERLMQYQRDLEAECRLLGIEKYRAEVERDQSVTPPGKKLLKKAVGLMEPAVADYVRQSMEGVASRSAGVVYFLASFEPMLLAYATSSACIKWMAPLKRGQKSLQDCAGILGRALEDTLNYEKLKAEDPACYRRLQRAVALKGNAHYKHVVLRKYQKHAQVKSIKWDYKTRVRVGLTLIHLFVESTGLATLEQGNGRDTLHLVAAEEVAHWLYSAHRGIETFAMAWQPMVVPPLPWTTPNDGGLLTVRMPVVKTRTVTYLKELEHAPMEGVYSAMNALQETAWAINGPVADVMAQAWDSSSTLGNLPSRDNIPLPPMVHDPEKDPEAHRAWKAEAAVIYARNVGLASARLLRAFELAFVNRMQADNIERIYFPYQMDWRGRMYPVTQLLSPQGNDATKALIRFADGVPLGDDGAYWLAVHGANCFGEDKVPFDQRVRWVEENEHHIRALVKDPLGYTWWDQADQPWQFLAFCFEWSNMRLQEALGRPREEYVSHLPVGLDGSCNGLQHFSMLLRDDVGGKAVNLVPSELPADIYTAVGEAAARIMQSRTHEPYGWAVWKDVFAVPKAARKLAKRPTMTMPYGARVFGFRDQLLALCSEEGWLEGHDRFLACNHLAKVIAEAIGKVVVKANECMDWLQRVSSVVTKDGQPVVWTAPSGMPIVQRYVQQQGERVRLTIAGMEYDLLLRVDGVKLDPARQRNGISPNFVHSMDAAHLVRTVNMCKADMIHSFAMVHDSYGTHAGNVSLLAWNLRSAFVSQYEGDLLWEFEDEIRQQISDDKLRSKMPARPAPGLLHADAVLQADYFFA